MSDDDMTGHHVETIGSRYLGTCVEIYCREVDERVPLMTDRYVRHCPMCGRSINVE